MTVIHSLMASLIDYAGLFPPAGLGMTEAAANYRRYGMGADNWALGRFIVPVSRLAEFEAVRASMPAVPHAAHWRLSVLGGDNPEADVEKACEFNLRKGSQPACVTVEGVEWRCPPGEGIERYAAFQPRGLEGYFEIPLSEDPRERIAAIRHVGGRVKIRTGGITPEMFPFTMQLARCITACAEMGVPFKATAGLHHPLRSVQAMTYEPASASVLMHGFLNVALASACALAGRGVEEAGLILREEDPGAIRFGEELISWRDRDFSKAHMERTRKGLFLSFGSCSFEEPVNELKQLHLRRQGT